MARDSHVVRLGAWTRPITAAFPQLLERWVWYPHTHLGGMYLLLITVHILEFFVC